MSKYSPLGDYLRAHSAAEVPMTFSDIESVIHTRLPPAADRHPAWWSNNPSNNVMTKVWLDAGYCTERVDLRARKLVFRRAQRLKAGSPEGAGKSLAAQPNIVERLGQIANGRIRFAPGFDATEPTGEVWDAEVS